MGEARSLEGCISIGPVGGPGGGNWSFRVKGGIKQIVMHHGQVIDSIVFKGDNGNGLMESSTKFGGNGGGKNDKIDIDLPMEYLTSISGTYGTYGELVPIKSLCFNTNRSKYGPFGTNQGTPFSIPMEGGAIVGFHGRAGIYLDAIGVYAKPVGSFDNECHNNEEVIDVMKAVAPCDPGPWGGLAGKPWDDGVFSAVKQVLVHVGNDGGVIHALQFQYEKMDGKAFWSQKHGGRGGEITKRINLESASEFIAGITGFYGPIEGSGGFEAIRSISFHTKGKYGPFGSEVGKYFASGFGGKIVGFHGRSSVYLDAIGIHMAYF